MYNAVHDFAIKFYEGTLPLKDFEPVYSIIKGRPITLPRAQIFLEEKRRKENKNTTKIEDKHLWSVVNRQIRSVFKDYPFFQGAPHFLREAFKVPTL